MFKKEITTFVVSMYTLLVDNPKRSLTYCCIFLVAIAAIIFLSSCGAYTALNQTLRYEYRLSRQSNVQTDTNLNINNYGKTE